jgi:protein SCO1/2
VFISIDPARDTIPRVKAYVREFHPRMLGLTGEFEAVKKVSKSYRWGGGVGGGLVDAGG